MLEKSVIQGEIKGNFTLSGVENALRSHWPDDQIKRRDGEMKNQANFQDEDEDMEPAGDEDDSYFEDWTPEEVGWYQEARAEEQKAWLQVQQARRTLREARARQHEVKMSRKSYRAGAQESSKGNGKGKGPVGQRPQRGPCFKCGSMEHLARDCPQNASSKMAEASIGEVEEADYTYHTTYMTDEVAATNNVLDDIADSSITEDNPVKREVQVQDELRGGEEPSALREVDMGMQMDVSEGKSNMVGSSYLRPANVPLQESEGIHHAFSLDAKKVTTEQAVHQGKAVIDGGATRTMGSLHAVEGLGKRYEQLHGQSGVSHIDIHDRPVFGFGNSQKSRCMSTCRMKLQPESARRDLRIHVLNEGTAPILLSIDTLRSMGAIIDFRANQAIFTSLDPRKLVDLEVSQAGHQLLPLAEDFVSTGQNLSHPIHGLQHLVQQE